MSQPETEVADGLWEKDPRWQLAQKSFLESKQTRFSSSSVIRLQKAQWLKSDQLTFAGFQSRPNFHEQMPM